MDELSLSDESMLWNSVSHGSLSDIVQNKESGPDLTFSIWDDAFDFLQFGNDSLMEATQSTPGSSGQLALLDQQLTASSVTTIPRRS